MTSLRQLWEAIAVVLAIALLLLPSSTLCSAREDTMDQALLFHCTGGCQLAGWSAQPAQARASLAGAGAHRRLAYRLSLQCWDPAQEGSPGTGCQLAVLQPLPATVFADPYELRRSAAAGWAAPARVFGAVDLESIEPLASPTTLALYHELPTQPGCAAAPEVRRFGLPTRGAALGGGSSLLQDASPGVPMAAGRRLGGGGGVGGPARALSAADGRRARLGAAHRAARGAAAAAALQCERRWRVAALAGGCERPQRARASLADARRSAGAPACGDRRHVTGCAGRSCGGCLGCALGAAAAITRAASGGGARYSWYHCCTHRTNRANRSGLPGSN